MFQNCKNPKRRKLENKIEKSQQLQRCKQKDFVIKRNVHKELCEQSVSNQSKSNCSFKECNENIFNINNTSSSTLKTSYCSKVLLSPTFMKKYTDNLLKIIEECEMSQSIMPLKTFAKTGMQYFGIHKESPRIPQKRKKDGKISKECPRIPQQRKKDENFSKDANATIHSNEENCYEAQDNDDVIINSNIDIENGKIKTFDYLNSKEYYRHNYCSKEKISNAQANDTANRLLKAANRFMSYNNPDRNITLENEAFSSRLNCPIESTANYFKTIENIEVCAEKIYLNEDRIYNENSNYLSCGSIPVISPSTSTVKNESEIFHDNAIVNEDVENIEVPADKICFNEDRICNENSNYFPSGNGPVNSPSIVDEDVTPNFRIEKNTDKIGDVLKSNLKTQAPSSSYNKTKSKISNVMANDVVDKLLTSAKSFLTDNGVDIQNSLVNELVFSKFGSPVTPFENIINDDYVSLNECRDKIDYSIENCDTVSEYEVFEKDIRVTKPYLFSTVKVENFNTSKYLEKLIKKNDVNENMCFDIDIKMNCPENSVHATPYKCKHIYCDNVEILEEPSENISLKNIINPHPVFDMNTTSGVSGPESHQVKEEDFSESVSDIHSLIENELKYTEDPNAFEVHGVYSANNILCESDENSYINKCKTNFVKCSNVSKLPIKSHNCVSINDDSIIDFIDVKNIISENEYLISSIKNAEESVDLSSSYNNNNSSVKLETNCEERETLINYTDNININSENKYSFHFTSTYTINSQRMVGNECSSIDKDITDFIDIDYIISQNKSLIDKYK